jgi:hypothetical protein
MKKIILIAFLILPAIGAFCQARTKKTDTAQNTPVATTTAFRMKYDDLFKHNTDGSVSPAQILQINGEMVNTGVKIARGVLFGGIDLGAAVGHDMLVDTVKGVVIVRKVL